MLTLRPAHPVYAAQEDAYQRNRQAEAHADTFLDTDAGGAIAFRDSATVQRIAERLRQQQHEQQPAWLVNEVMDAITEAFKAGWNAAREQQRIG